MKSVCLAILHFSDIEFLEHLLPTATAAVASYGIDCPIIILDNGSSEELSGWVKSHFPTVEVEPAPKNDYLYSYNWLLTKRTEDVVIILNNDLRVSEHFIHPLLRHFQAPDVFAVGATSRNWDNTLFTCGPARLSCHHGWYSWDWERDCQKPCHTLFASGGFVALDRNKFLELGGFNRLFYPGYGEDLDLCFRAWRRGWRTIFEPASIVFHRESASWDQGGNRRSERLMLRAQLLFYWSSIPIRATWFERAAFFILTGKRRIFRGQVWWLGVWVRTWFEWLLRRQNYRALMTSPHELNGIMDRIAAPVVTATRPKGVSLRHK
jgi:GT2 family glycosyltransferase